jgi:signal transduction histidine kinase
MSSEKGDLDLKDLDKRLKKEKKKEKKKKKKILKEFVEQNKLEKLELENERLKKQLKNEFDKSLIRNEMIFQQSRFALMGEMIGNIAHQWRQPLMEMSTLFMKEEAKIKLLGSVDKDDVLQTISQANIILKYMSSTIDDFKNFFATNKEKEEFFIAKQISKALALMNETLKNHDIKVNVFIKNNIKLNGYSNEYTQILMNIVSNAKDAIVGRDIQNGIINIKLYQLNGDAVLEIEDNAGGIECEPIDKIFEPFFTFEKVNGTGIGLFMSRLIVEKNMDGKLSVENCGKGACFKVITPIE